MKRFAALVGLVVSVSGLVVAASSVGSGSVEPALDGAALFVAKGCASCHDGPGRPSPVGVGPSLADAGTWAATRVRGMAAATYLETSMLDPDAFISPEHRGGSVMPVLNLAPGEIDLLVAYLLWR